MFGNPVLPVEIKLSLFGSKHWTKFAIKIWVKSVHGFKSYGITYKQTINNTDRQTLMITINILILKLGNLTLPWETKLSLSESKHSIWNHWTTQKPVGLQSIIIELQ